MNDPNGFILLMQAALKAWRGPGISQKGLYPGEAILTRPQRMSDKEYRAAKARLSKNGLLTFRIVRQHTICCLTKDCEKLADPQVIWGEVRGEPSSAANPARAGHPSHRTSLRGEPRGEVEGLGANLLTDRGEVRGEPRGELPLVEKSRPANTCEADQDARGELRGEVEGEVPVEKGRTLNKKEDKNKDSSSWGDLLEALWAEVAPRGRADKPPKAIFQRKCKEWLPEHPTETVRALIEYANANSDRNFTGHIDWAIKNGHIQTALDYWHAAIEQKLKASESSSLPKSQEEISRNAERFHQQFALLKAKLRIDEADIPPLEAALDSHLAQSGQPTPCAHGALSGAVQGLCPLEPRKDESQEPKA